MSRLQATAVILLLFILLQPNSSNAQQLDWATNMGGSGNDYGRAVVTDGVGNVYTTGFFSGTVDFDPGAGTQSLTSAGLFDVFIMKMNAAGDFKWVRQIGTTTTDAAYSIALDGKGNLYTAGRFEGTVDFDPSSGTYNLTSAGGADVFVQKMDTAGSFVWAGNMGGTTLDQPTTVHVDGAGDVYIAGTFTGTADFDPSSGTYNLTSAGGDEIFLCKLSSAGSLVWAKGIGSTAADRGYSMTLDADYNVYATGIFSGTVDFDPNSGTHNLTSAGNFDFYVLKLDSAGNFKWANNAGGTSFDFGWDITTDKAGYVYTAGYFQQTTDLDPSSGTYGVTAVGNYDIFIQKLDSAGNFIWAKTAGGSGDDRGYSIEVDDSAHIYLTGYYQQTADFDPSQSTFNLTVAGASDFYLLKLDSAGSFLYAGSMGGNGTGGDFGLNLTLDHERSIFITGNYDGTADFDPDSTTTHNISSAGVSDAFILKLKQCVTYGTLITAACDSFISPSGNFVWTVSGNYKDTLTNAKGCDSIVFIDLTIHPVYTTPVNVFVCKGDSILLEGSYQTSAGTYYDTLSTVSGCDSVIVSSLTVNPTFNTFLVKEICQGDSIFLGGAYRDTFGLFFDSLHSVNGCDSIITSRLIVHPITVTNLQVSICTGDSLFAQGEYRDQPGTYYDTLIAATGCDSVIITVLDVLPQITTNADASICSGDSILLGGAYRYDDGIFYDTLIAITGCDSIVVTSLTVNVGDLVNNSVTICRGDSIYAEGAYRTTTGIYTDNYVNFHGCDSVVFTDLTVNEADTSVTITGSTLTANATAASYRWLDCGNNYSFITGAVQQSFTPTATGDYAVEVTENGCTDTSFCYNVLVTGLEEQVAQEFTFKLYPNPANSVITLAFDLEQYNVWTELLSLEGKMLSRENFIGQTNIRLNLQAVTPGIYFLKVITEEGTAIRKFVKE